MTVRYFCENDRETFRNLCREFYNSDATLRGYDDKTAGMTFDRILDHHENLWGFLMTDKETDQPVGYALITSYWCNEEGGNVLVIDELYISPVNRHKGYATKFMEWLQTENRNKAVAVTLEVLTTNVNARALYKSEGFSPDGFMTYTKRLS